MSIKKILVSQPKPLSDKSPYFDIAKKHNVELTFRPFIKVEGLTGKELRQAKINLADYTGVIFTARSAVDNYFRLCEDMRVEVLETTKYFCTNESIANYLQKYIVYRKRKIFFGKSGKLDDADLLKALTKHNKEKILFPISEQNKESFDVLDKHKIKYTKAVMFRTVSNDFAEDEPFDYDMLLFFSPSGISSLLKNFPNFKEEKKDVRIGCFGTTTAQAVREAGLKLDLEAPTPKTPSMTAALEKYLADVEAELKKKKK